LIIAFGKGGYLSHFGGISGFKISPAFARYDKIEMKK